MPLNPTSQRTKLLVSGTTKISDRMTWKHLQQFVRDKNEEFIQPLAQNFLLLQQVAKNKKDPISIKTLDVIVSGFIELATAMDKRSTPDEFSPSLSSTALSIFTRLAESYNNPNMLKQAGLHYMMEWRLPEAALTHFQRALDLGGSESALRSLIEVATIAVHRKETLRKGATDTGITKPKGVNVNVTQIIRDTDKILITKTQRPVPRASFMARTMKLKTTEALPEATKDRLAQAAQEIEKGNLAQARDLLQKAARQPVKKDILCAMWSNLGRAWYLADNYIEMEDAYAHAYLADPKGSTNYFNLALAKSLNNKIAEAETLYQMAAKLDPDNPKVWCNLGVLYFQHDRFSEAEQAFRSAVAYGPDYARAWDNLASALSALGKTEEAIEACRKAIELRPGYPEAYFKLSGLYLGKGDPASLTEAASALSYVVNYAPLAASANGLLSMIHSRLERVDAAKASLQRAVATDPKCPLLPTVWNELESAIRAS